jgi:hypothetical protein
MCHTLYTLSNNLGHRDRGNNCDVLVHPSIHIHVHALVHVCVHVHAPPCSCVGSFSMDTQNTTWMPSMDMDMQHGHGTAA